MQTYTDDQLKDKIWIEYRIIEMDKYGDANEIAAEDGHGAKHRIMRVWKTLTVSGKRLRLTMIRRPVRIC